MINIGKNKTLKSYLINKTSNIKLGAASLVIEINPENIFN